MKRKILFVCLACVLAFIAGIGGILYKANDILSSYKPTLERAVFEALGAEVSFGKISLSLLNQEISTESVLIGSKSSSELTVGGLRAKANIFALLQNTLEIEELSLDRLTATVNRDQQGVNVSGLLNRAATGSPRFEGDGSTSATTHSTDTAVGAPSKKGIIVSLKRFALRDSTVHYKDLILGKTVTLSGLSVSSGVRLEQNTIKLDSMISQGEISTIGKFTLTTTSLAASLDGRKLSIDGTEFSLPTGTIAAAGALENDTGKFSIKAQKLLLDKIEPLASIFTSAIAPLQLSGQVTADLTAEFSKKSNPHSFLVKGPISISGASSHLSPTMNLSQFNGDFALDLTQNDFSVSTSNLKVLLQGEPLSASFKAKLKDKELSISPLSFTGFTTASSPSGESGSSSLTLRFNDTQDFSSQFRGKGLSIQKIAKVFKPDLTSHITGEISSLENEAFGELKKIPASLSAHGASVLVKGALKGINLPGLVLKKVEGIPFLKGSLLMLVPPTYQPLFASPDTPINRLQITYGLAGTTATIKSITLESDIFTLTGRGTIAGSGRVDFHTTITFTKEFSTALCTSLPQLKTILAADERLTFPLVISGTPPLVVVAPDLKDVATLAAKRAVKDKALEILDKTLGGAAKGWSGSFGF